MLASELFDWSSGDDRIHQSVGRVLAGGLGGGQGGQFLFDENFDCLFGQGIFLCTFLDVSVLLLGCFPARPLQSTSDAFGELSEPRVRAGGWVHGGCVGGGSIGKAREEICHGSECCGDVLSGWLTVSALLPLRFRVFDDVAVLSHVQDALFASVCV